MTCGNCIYYFHHSYYNWSSSDTPLITSITICDFCSDGYPVRGYNCVICENFVLKPKSVLFDYNEKIGEQLSLF